MSASLDACTEPMSPAGSAARNTHKQCNYRSPCSAEAGMYCDGLSRTCRCYPGYFYDEAHGACTACRMYRPAWCDIATDELESAPDETPICADTKHYCTSLKGPSGCEALPIRRRQHVMRECPATCGACAEAVRADAPSAMAAQVGSAGLPTAHVAAACVLSACGGMLIAAVAMAGLRRPGAQVAVG